jgi:pimeloyl-ACP methyl ester carboxylesterase
LRLISPDRPGIGLSSFQPKRRLLDWPPLLAEMCDLLGLERFRILGISGGGPYTLAAAWALGERVKAIAVVCGAPPLPAGTDAKTLLFVYRWLLGVYRRRPEIIRAVFRAARPIATLKPPLWMWPWILRFVPSSDSAALRDPAVFEGSFENYRESWRGSALGVVSDAEVHAADWGFRPEEIRVPVRLWHGKDDRNFSWKLAEDFARRLPDCETHFVENEGHYSLPIRRYREILENLKAARVEAKI